MSTQNRRSSFSSSTKSSLAKRNASSSENVRKYMAVPPHLTKKRAPLSNVTNQRNVAQSGSKGTLSSSVLVPCSNKISKAKKATAASHGNTTISSNFLPAYTNGKASTAVPVPCKITSLPRSDENSKPNAPSIAVSCSMDVSPSESDADSVSMDESMSVCDSFKSPEVEYLDNIDVPLLDSIDRSTFRNLYISDQTERTENVCSRDILAEMETDDKIVNVDDNYMDPQLCAPFACDIYKHLCASEEKKRPSADFMERIQKDINASMRAILIDWLVEVAEEYRLVPDTLHLTVNYIDRYLSGNQMNRQWLQLLGVACMMIAAKFEEICAPQVEEFCFITDNTYFKEEVPSMQLECLANYLTELSLLDYSMLCHAPSLTAASTIFLAKYILLPSKRPWDSTLLR